MAFIQNNFWSDVLYHQTEFNIECLSKCEWSAYRVFRRMSRFFFPNRLFSQNRNPPRWVLSMRILCVALTFTHQFTITIGSKKKIFRLNERTHLWQRRENQLLWDLDKQFLGYVNKQMLRSHKHYKIELQALRISLDCGVMSIILRQDNIPTTYTDISDLWMFYII